MQQQSPTPTASASSESQERGGAEERGTSAQAGRPSYPDLLPRFDYDSKSALELRETNFEKRGNIMMIELNYAGAGGDRVPAYLLLPRGNGPFAAVIWGHWLMKGSPLANKDEFLEEALALARAGVVSLLIDAPQARHEYTAEKDQLEFAQQQSDLAMHQVIDLRRGVDLLLVRKIIDPNRIAYVGHSWDAHVGAILAGVETRICCYVLMGSGYSDEADTFASREPEIVRLRQQLGDEKVHEYFREYAFDDPVHFTGHTDRESIFLQFATGDHVSREQAEKYLSGFSAKDKQMQIYDASHALNAAARLDRIRWLQKHLGIKKVDESELSAIPQLK